MSEANRGSVVSVRGSVVDIRFENNLPPIYSVLHAGDEGRIVIKVLAQLDSHRVRGIALTPTRAEPRTQRLVIISSTAFPSIFNTNSKPGRFR